MSFDCGVWEAQFIARENRRRAALLSQRIACLGRNLMIAGALERAYDLGSEHGRWQYDTQGFDDSHPWWSNVDGRSAP